MYIILGCHLRDGRQAFSVDVCYFHRSCVMCRSIRSKLYRSGHKHRVDKSWKLLCSSIDIHESNHKEDLYDSYLDEF